MTASPAATHVVYPSTPSVEQRSPRSAAPARLAPPQHRVEGAQRMLQIAHYPGQFSGDGHVAGARGSVSGETVTRTQRPLKHAHHCDRRHTRPWLTPCRETLARSLSDLGLIYCAGVQYPAYSCRMKPTFRHHLRTWLLPCCLLLALIGCERTGRTPGRGFRMPRPSRSTIAAWA